MRRRFRRGWWWGTIVVGTVTIAALIVPALTASVAAEGRAWAGAHKSVGSPTGSQNPVGACSGWPNGSFPGSLLVTTDPQGNAPSWRRSPEPVIDPGQTVDVTIAWKASELQGSTWVGVANCLDAGKVGGRTLDKVWTLAPPQNVGTDQVETSFVVPDSLDGRLLCDSAWLWVSPTENTPNWNGSQNQGGSQDWSGSQSTGWSQNKGGAQNWRLSTWNAKTPKGNWVRLEKSNSVCWLVGPAAQTPEVQFPVVLGVLALVCTGGYVVVVRRRDRRAGSGPHESAH